MTLAEYCQKHAAMKEADEPAKPTLKETLDDAILLLGDLIAMHPKDGQRKSEMIKRLKQLANCSR